MWPPANVVGGAGGVASDRWTRRFCLGPTTTHPRGFSLYQITSYVFPNNSPEAITTVTVWKRYSDLQKLQRKMRNMHQDLHLRGNCPYYAKWSYFNRFDAQVIEERKQTTQALLEFIAVHPPLFTSTDFVNFFQSSHPDPNLGNPKNQPGKIEEIRNSLLLPTDAMKPLEYQSSEEESFSTADSPSVSTMDSASVNSSIINNDYSMEAVLNQRENRYTYQNIDSIETSINAISADNLKVDSKSISQNRNSTDNLSKIFSRNNSSRHISNDAKQCINNVSFKSNLPDLILFDNVNSMERSQISIDSDESIYFVNSIAGVNNEKEKKSCSDSIEALDCVDNIRQHQNDSEIGNVSIPKETESSLQVVDKNTKVFDGLTLNQKNKYENMKLSFKDNNISDVKNNNSTNFMSLESHIQKNANLESSANQLDIFSSSTDLQENYVFEAGYLLSLGAKNEAKGDYETAFDCYKLGIEKLLIGVQGDQNEHRRQFVKDKVSKYLSHAEKIYTQHLNSENELSVDGSLYIRMNKPMITAKPKRYINKSDLCKPYCNLSEYRVLGILSGQVMFVLHSETQECFAMKVIQKSCNSISDDDYFNKGQIENLLPILPTDIPYMVKLKSYIETPNLLFLVLQYASGGKLFEYIHTHSKSVPNTPIREVNLENIFINLDDLPKFNKNDVASNYHPDLNRSIDSNKIVKIENDQIVNTEFKNDSIDEIAKSENSTRICDFDLSVTDMVINSQRLLLNVDDALSGKFLKDKEDCIKISTNDIQGDLKKPCNKLDLIEQAFDGIQAKLQKIESSIQSKVPLCSLPPKSVCKWGAELLLAIEHLHQCGVICWTLNPENLLLGDGGHLFLTYFTSRDCQDVLLPFLNTFNNGPIYNLYIAPELQRFPFLKKNEFDENVCDFWSFGAVMYELITGMPLSALHPTGFNSHTILNFPNNLSQEAESLLSQLLTFNPKERLGSGPSQEEEIKNHPYFKNINWKTVLEDFNVSDK
ncbi:uncharacterized protein LOC143918473 [Arctopsyche grandis]|uniref:uncharacterized protein LOC143918473 n=1 Tax=Arctopsyche grandis TaxID=121162 RepID=UPI00406D96B8